MSFWRSLPERAARLLGRVDVRAVLSAAIILSLLPFAEVDRYAWAFLVLFGAELVLRVAALWRVEPEAGDGAPGRRRLTAIGLVLLDAVALLSFVPWSHTPDSARWLRLFRLSRLLLLLAYWAPLVRDVRSILAQRERSRNVVLMGFTVAALTFAGAVALEHLAPDGADFDGNGKLDRNDRGFAIRLWWAFRQIQDPGNMLESPTDIAAVAVSLCLTLAGLFLVSFLIGLGADVVRELVELSRARPPGLSRHLVVVHATPAAPRVLAELVRHYRKAFTTPRGVLLGHLPDRPVFLEQPGLRHIAYRRGDPAEPDGLLRADCPRARRIVVLADPHRAEPDAHTTGIMLTVRESNADAWLVAEILDPRNMSAARVAGGARTVIVPTEKLLGLVVAAAVLRPGLEDLLRELLSSAGHEVYTYLYDVPHLDCPHRMLQVDGADHLARIYDLGAADGAESRIALLGVIHPPGPGERRLRTCLGAPGAESVPEGGRVAGLVGIAENFRAMERFALRVLDGPPPPPAPAPRPLPPLAAGARRDTLRDVLVCGFRPAGVHLLEALMRAAPQVHVQILVATKRERAEALAMLRERSMHQALGLWNEPGPAGRFVELPGDELTYHPEGQTTACGRLRVDVADWTQSRELLDLPGTGRSLGDMDLVLALGGPHPDDDARTATTLLKIADLMGTGRVPFAPDFRLLGLVVDERLGSLLEKRFATAAGEASERLRVLSTRQYGAYFVFQSAVVPGFDAVFSEVLSPWGQSFELLRPAPGGDPAARWTFGELSRALRAARRTLLAVALRDGDGPARLCVTPNADEPGATFAWGDVTGLWVTDDASAPAGQRTPRPELAIDA